MSFAIRKEKEIYFYKMKKYLFRKGLLPKHLTFFIPHPNEYAGLRIFKEILKERLEKKGIETQTIIGPSISERGFKIRSELFGEQNVYNDLIHAILSLEDHLFRFRTWYTQIKLHGPNNIIFEMHCSNKVSEKTKVPSLDFRRLGSTYHLVVPHPFDYLKKDVFYFIKIISSYLDEGAHLLKTRNLSLNNLKKELKKLIHFLSFHKAKIKAVEFAAQAEPNISDPTLFDFYFKWTNNKYVLFDLITDFELDYCLLNFIPLNYSLEDIELVEKVLVLPKKK
ncbi:MAG: hypothetical protein N3D10_02815 [Candidatus Micrarchaeota archaeon]|nr:hypothetical protein [Candidatus Micrarchaeota archaeon]